MKEYFEELKKDFENRSPEDQSALVKNMARVVILAIAIVISTFFYQFCPLLIRVFAFPAFIVGAYFVASQVEPKTIMNVARSADRLVRSTDNAFRSLHPVLKKAPSMALMSGLLIVACSLAGFAWYFVAGR